MYQPRLHVEMSTGKGRADAACRGNEKLATSSTMLSGWVLLAARVWRQWKSGMVVEWDVAVHSDATRDPHISLT
jgi:hypothetical protein